MEGRGPSHSPAPLPLGQRQLPFPFILPENLGPLPSPERRPLVPLGETGAARRLSPPSDEPHHLAYLWQASLRAGPEDPRAGTTVRRDSSLKSLMSKLGRPRSLQPSELPILPPPLPTSPQQPGSPACRQTSSQVALLNNRIEIPPASLWPRTMSPGQKESPHHHKHPSPETPPHNGQTSPVAVRYNCDQCPESFLTNGALKRHRRVHLERNFHCPCGAAYTDMSVLRVSTPRVALAPPPPSDPKSRRVLTQP